MAEEKVREVVVLEANTDFLPVEDQDEPITLDEYMTRPWNVRFVRSMINPGDEETQLLPLIKRKPYAFFNLCDGIDGKAGHIVARILEKHQVAFTGGRESFASLSKEDMHRKGLEGGIRMPGYLFVKTEEELKKAAETLRFPLIIKHENSGGSHGMTAKSRMNNLEEFWIEAPEFVKKYGGGLIEEFIEGREFTVMAIGDADLHRAGVREIKVLVPVECQFQKGETFKHYEVKHKDEEAILWIPVKDEVLRKKIEEETIRAYLAMDADSYGRIDYRMDADGNLYFLEINTYPGIYYRRDYFGSADWILSHDEKFDHQSFMEEIIELANLSLEHRLKKETQ
eukprot:TRINITY_DN1505_c0_g4_i1.p1 TRINITY_DN1505_c0_g4~~TRINITY_DN1505_c0_g4_i1.p1  ORF type:complete len:340 (-),score=119.86 TRINITY_DN1505_c0_g4_i1:161-1180(-)